jgi:TatD DNase family protein
MTEVLLFDTHCHLDDRRFDEDREALINSLPDAGVYACLSCGSDLETSRASIAIAERYPFIYAAAGIHPHEAAKAGEGDLDMLIPLLAHPKVLALGEIGLDFHYDFSPRDVQRKWLLAQLDLAYTLGKPMVLHVREAQGEMTSLLQERKGRLPGGVLHSYSGSAESAQQYLDMGLYISFSGSVTFKNADNLRRAARVVPLDRLLIETDSPYLTPVPFRGKRNNPALVRHVCETLAELFEMPYEDMARITRDNARRLLGV